MCVQNYPETVQLIHYTQVNVCTKLPVCTKLTVQLIIYTLVNVCTKLLRHCAFNNLHAGKCVNKTT